MGNGLERFAQGLALSLIEKAKETGRSPKAQLMQEEDEMALLLAFLQAKVSRQSENIKDRDLSAGMLGAALFGQYLIEGLATNVSDVESLQREIQNRAKAFTQFFEDFESESISLEGSVSNVSRLKKAWTLALAGSDVKLPDQSDLVPSHH